MFYCAVPDDHSTVHPSMLEEFRRSEEESRQVVKICTKKLRNCFTEVCTWFI